MVEAAQENEVTCTGLTPNAGRSKTTETATMSLYSQRSNGSSTDSNNNDGDYEQDKKLKTTPDAGFTGNLRTVFGNATPWGDDSLGVAFENVEIEDGVLYKHTEKDEWKLFAWEEVIGAHPAEYDEAVSADKPDQYMTKTYGSTRVKYEFVGAKIAEVHRLDENGDPTGDILCEEDTSGDYEIGNVIMWNDGNETPKPASRTLAKLLTEQGSDMVIEKDEAKERGNAGYNDDGDLMWVQDWLTDTSNENVAREDLKGRELRFFKEARQSDESEHFFHHPIVEDVKTGKQIRVKNSGEGQEGESTDSSPSESESGSSEGASSDGTPEPVQDYLDTVGGMEADDVLANSLLEDMIEEPDNNLTEAMVDAEGGREALVEQVVGQSA